ncbi:serine/threonine-protein kinase [Paucibacter sediminis]|uniref:Serine/threonine-protein kinase n=1 Tax=Paucibacter sediminis TaxID=3019553 RepID=A0AA95SPQ1_9BURK|nr:serine/threonine-protein kinase [Paucibacter sp. S2-9]WIT11091.1 serine/threonine-protein kinase [Paucibacter sp. S2-9]
MDQPAYIGKYRISGVLGRGAMGVVYKGFDPHIQRAVAIKTILKSLLDGDQGSTMAVARFRNEAQAVGRIAHPGVVAIHEFGEDADSAYIVMEFVEGSTLQQVLMATPMLGLPALLHLMDQLLDALEHAHRQGVWHRDIKPSNLLLSVSGQLKLTDFGIARIENLGLTRVSSVIGTPGYMAPEQYLGEGVDQRADLFAAGVLLYRLLAGVLPFNGNAQQVMYKVLNEAAAPPSQVALAARPALFDSVVERAMAKRPEQRFGSAAEFRSMLAGVASMLDPALHGDAEIGALDQWAKTLVMAATTYPTTRPATASAGAPSSQGHGSWASHWDGPSLSRIERSLASHVGPMARLMVREAARQCHDLQSLASAVAAHIADAEARQRFLQESTEGSQLAPMGSTGIVAPPRDASLAALAASGQALDEALKSHALAVLSHELGPIAKVLVKRAAARAGSAEQFIEGLLAECPELDAQQLRQALQAPRAAPP